MAQNNQILPSKEATLFRHLVQFYETKQYKKGLKAAEQILRKHPAHGDTQAMKALILNTTGKQEEAFELCKLALKNAMKSHVCWHVYGLLYRSVKNYEEAIKAYRFALRLDPESVQIQKDLALLQVHMRDYAGYVQSRNQMLQARPQIRQNWTALAVALQLSGDLEKAEDVLTRYEETLKQTPPKTDIEHAEAVLYKNTIIAESGDLQRALDHLDSIYKTALDRVSVMELRAQYLLRLEKREEAEKAYRALLNRNPEKREYYDGLEGALGLKRGQSEDVERLVKLYTEYADKSARTDAPRRVPLDFLQGEAFRAHADVYLRKMFLKGVPSTFANLKQLYSDPQKLKTIQELVEGYVNEDPQAQSAEQSNGDSQPKYWQLSVNYFLAQHYNYHSSRNLKKAQEYIEKAIALNPSKTDYTYHMTRARIQKHLGDTEGASKAMNAAREMDLKDRYINTKCAKYQLRNNEHEAAIGTMGLFTRKEAVGGPLGDLLDMQCVWFITEDGESYFREGNLNLALKRFKAVYDIFEVWIEDQFDFHTFSLRKGIIRAYVDMIRWADTLREHPFYTRAALSAIQIYLLLADRPELAAGGSGADGESAADKKKAAKKAKKEAEKAEAERKAAAAKKAMAKAEDEGVAKKEDSDPLGYELLKTSTPLDEAMKYLNPILELSPKNFDGQVAGFEVFLRREKYLPALKCHLAAVKLGPEHPKNFEQAARLQLALSRLTTPLPKETSEVIQSLFLSARASHSVPEETEQFLHDHRDSAAHVHSALRVRFAIDPKTAAANSAADVEKTLDLPGLTIEQAIEGRRLLEEVRATSDVRKAYSDKAAKRWPQAPIFQS